MKTIKIDEKTHKNLMSIKILYECKTLSEAIQKGIDSLEADLIIAAVKPNDK